jgi:hypothetical protein
MSKRAELIDRIWGGIDPLVSSRPLSPDFQGWASDHPYLVRAIEEVRPSVVVEIGVWKGGSVMTMADHMKALSLDGVVIAVDTWLGAWDHWIQPQWFSHLKFENGYPSIYHTFASNIISRQLQGYVVPLPLDSLNAVKVCAHHGLTVDVLHVDGGHDFAAVTADLAAWWPMLRDGGVLIGDDYHSEGDVWPEVREAFQAFFNTKDIEATGGKCYIRK